MKFSDVTTLREVSQKHGVNYHTLRYRVKRAGLTTVKKNGRIFIDRKSITKELVTK